MNDVEQRVITPLPASHPELGRWLWALEDTRTRTKAALAGLDQVDLDWTGPGVENAIGSLLYHLALIEFDYLYADILGQDYPEGSEVLLPESDRDGDGNLSIVRGVSLADHLARLDEVRRQLLQRVSVLSAEQLATARTLPDSGYVISAAWTLHHLMQHE
ncbi:MAG: DinB family protein, partial [Chloroflexota bacterium]|nr:DinB family protein [Chloroflexota bacterium]